jgi:hypothetical protein
MALPSSFQPSGDALPHDAAPAFVSLLDAFYLSHAFDAAGGSPPLVAIVGAVGGGAYAVADAAIDVLAPAGTRRLAAGVGRRWIHFEIDE